jgi:hypothetical protein
MTALNSLIHIRRIHTNAEQFEAHKNTHVDFSYPKIVKTDEKQKWY